MRRIGKGCLLAIGGCALLAVLVALCSSPSKETPATATATQPPPTARPTEAPRATETLAPPTLTPLPSDTPLPTATLVPTEPPRPLDLRGTGQTATESFYLPSAISVARFTHDGSSNFIVRAYQGTDEDLVINEIGPYQGARPLTGEGPIVLDIDADGNWTVHIESIAFGGTPEFAGRGDDVSAVFDPPTTGAWQFHHDGSSNFIVMAHCAGGSVIVQNEIGAVDGSGMVSFRQGPCFWEVQADGDWSLKPR